jgi:hypothetical protein
VETELEGEERNHICNPWDLSRFQTQQDTDLSS